MEAVTETQRTPDIPALTEVHQADPGSAPWWRDAVIYQVYPRSWADADGDGVGDLAGVTQHLDHLVTLGVDAVWFSPFYRSPQADAGYDVTDYRDIDPLFGTLEDFAHLVDEAHRHRIKVIVDLVPNHSSDEHAWFQAALAARPGSPERARYVFREGGGPDGAEPPNDWRSVFGGRAWTRVPDGQWYLHLFDRKQPDFNWDHPDVRAEFLDILAFWLDRGVDGFRVDVAHGLVKKDGLPDWPHQTDMIGQDDTGRAPMWDQDGVHEIYRSWRKLLESYGEPDRIMCAEAWVKPINRLMRYVRPDEFHQTFNFDFLDTPWRARDLREVITRSLEQADSVGAPSSWVLSNHDVVRHVSRLGLPVGEKRPNGISIRDPQPDADLGQLRARAATALMLSLPGGAYLYQGEELGLPDSTDMPDRFRQDPAFARTGGAETGRDGCRVPMPWVRDAPAHGFSATGEAWLPQPAAYGPLAVDQQLGVQGSTLELYRALLALRAELGLGVGGLSVIDGDDEDVLTLLNSGRRGQHRVLVLANVSGSPVDLPEGADVLVRSGPLTVDGRVPADTTVWALLPER
jgi:alpha-glucosidase